MIYQDRNVRDKWLKNYINEMNSKKENKQMDVIISFINKPLNKIEIREN